MISAIQVEQITPILISIGVYKNRLGKIRLSDYHGKNYVILIFYLVSFTSIALTELIGLSD